MNAREYFETVRAAQRGIDRRLAVLASMRERETVRAQRYDAGPHGMGGENHSMEATVSRMDYESSAECEILRGLADAPHRHGARRVRAHRLR